MFYCLLTCLKKGVILLKRMMTWEGEEKREEEMGRDGGKAKREGKTEGMEEREEVERKEG